MLKLNVIIERDEDGYYVGSVPELPGCHTQAKTVDELRKLNMPAGVDITIKV